MTREEFPLLGEQTALTSRYFAGTGDLTLTPTVLTSRYTAETTEGPVSLTFVSELGAEPPTGEEVSLSADQLRARMTIDQVVRIAQPWMLPALAEELVSAYEHEFRVERARHEYAGLPLAPTELEGELVAL